MKEEISRGYGSQGNYKSKVWEKGFTPYVIRLKNGGIMTERVNINTIMMGKKRTPKTRVKYKGDLIEVSLPDSL